jgi:hypothetical protein
LDLGSGDYSHDKGVKGGNAGHGVVVTQGTYGP